MRVSYPVFNPKRRGGSVNVGRAKVYLSKEGLEAVKRQIRDMRNWPDPLDDFDNYE